MRAEFHVDGAAVLKARLLKYVLLNGVCEILHAEWRANTFNKDGITGSVLREVLGATSKGFRWQTISSSFIGSMYCYSPLAREYANSTRTSEQNKLTSCKMCFEEENSEGLFMLSIMIMLSETVVTLWVTQTLSTSSAAVEAVVIFWLTHSLQTSWDTMESRFWQASLSKDAEVDLHLEWWDTDWLSIRYRRSRHTSVYSIKDRRRQISFTLITWIVKMLMTAHHTLQPDSFIKLCIFCSSKSATFSMKPVLATVTLQPVVLLRASSHPTLRGVFFETYKANGRRRARSPRH